MARNGKGSIWEDPRSQDELVRLANQKLSGSEIAAILGVSRNSIIGRAHRTGVKLVYPMRLREANGDFLVQWAKNPENLAYRNKRLLEAICGKITEEVASTGIDS